MNWRTEISLKESDFYISHKDFMLGMGSCFAVHMHEKFEYFGFGSVTNPTGILYNSRSISKMLNLLLGKEKLDESRFVERDEMICHYDFHMDMRAKNKEDFMDFLVQAQKAFQASWEKASVIIITLGTANVYTKENEIVANCHKQPNSLFTKQVMSIEEIISDIKQITLLAEAKKTLFTVSPVRHLKDGFIENQLSKAHLISAIHKIGVSYFPAYEIVIDDLRDYRFYKKDLVHPSEEAVDYVWEKFKSTYFKQETIDNIKRVHKFRSLQNHRPFNTFSISNEANTKKKAVQFQALKQEIPHLKEKLETKSQ